MGFLRAAVRSVPVCLSTLQTYLCVLLSKPLKLASPRASAAAQYFWIQSWARLCSRVLGLHVRVSGTPPRPPFFLVSNHLSYVDVLVYHSLVRGCFLAKAEVARWPVMGIMARGGNTLFIDRERRRDLTRVLDEVQAVLDGGGGVIVFPEGTSTMGAEVAPFKPSIFEIALRTGIPVSTASVTYATPEAARPAHLSVCWWGDMGFLSHLLRLLTLPRIDAVVAFGATALTGGDRKSLARRAQGAVAASFTPVVASAEAAEPCAP